MQQLLIGLDIGTSAVKGIMITDEGEIAGRADSSNSVSNPRAGWSEQNPEDWWESTVEVLRELGEQSENMAAELAGLSFSGQMHSSVFLDAEDKVIRPAILWSDTRTDRECQEIEKQVGGRKNLVEMTGNRALEGFTAPKVLWLKNNEPDNYKKVESLLLPKDYIRYRLTGEKAMDLSDAAGTLLFDVEKGDWNDELLQLLDIDCSILPPPVESTSVAGRITEAAAEITGLPAGLPVVAGGADNACGAAGSGMVRQGQLMVSIGSSGVVLAPADEYRADPEGKVHLFNHSSPGKYYYMGVMLAAGQALSWCRDNVLPPDWDYDIINEKAASVPPGSENLIFLPYLNGERTPHADASARGVFFGLSALHDRSHMVRSVMEGVTFGLRDSLELIEERGVEVDSVRAIGGGARSEIWQQIIADIMDKTVELLAVEEGPAYGAALIAGVGVDIFPGLEWAEKELIEIEKTVEPTADNAEKYDELYDIYRDLYPSLKDDFARLDSK